MRITEAKLESSDKRYVAYREAGRRKWQVYDRQDPRFLSRVRNRAEVVEFLAALAESVRYQR